MKIIVVIAGVGFFAYLFVMLWMYKFQESIIFPGTALVQTHEFIQEPYLHERFIEVDGAKLNALHFQQPSARGLIFFLHGNAGNLDSWLPDVDFYRQENYDVFMLDYRGYGKSTGKIQSQEQVNKDILTAWHSVASLYDNKPIVIYGRSIGTYFATQLATQVKSDLLVLVSPFTNMQHIARQKFSWLPTQLLRYPLATDKSIQAIRSPLLILHGAEDRLIPPSHAHQLYALMPQASLTIIEQAAHNDIHDFDEYEAVLAKTLP